MARCQWLQCLRDATHGLYQIAGRGRWHCAQAGKKYHYAQQTTAVYCAWHATCTAVQRNARLREATR